MVSVLASRVVDGEFGPCSDQTEDHEIGICCFPAKYTALRSTTKDWVALNWDQCVRVKRHVYMRTVIVL
jgi:hypothetical protein